MSAFFSALNHTPRTYYDSINLIPFFGKKGVGNVSSWEKNGKSLERWEGRKISTEKDDDDGENIAQQKFYLSQQDFFLVHASKAAAA